MHIDNVYLSTYSQSEPLRGRFEIKESTFKQTIKFAEDEAAQIQEICAKALERTKAEIAAKLLAADIRVPQLEAPKSDGIEDADFDEVF